MTFATTGPFASPAGPRAPRLQHASKAAREHPGKRQFALSCTLLIKMALVDAVVQVVCPRLSTVVTAALFRPTLATSVFNKGFHSDLRSGQPLASFQVGAPLTGRVIVGGFSGSEKPQSCTMQSWISSLQLPSFAWLQVVVFS